MRQSGRFLTLRFLAILAASALLHPFALGQATAGRPAAAAAASPSPQSKPVDIPAAPGPALQSSDCPVLKDQFVPVSRTIEAKVTTLVDSAHFKPGKKIWANSLFDSFESGSGCRLTKGAVIYGRVTAAASSKSPARSELGLQFDRADCMGHSPEALKLILIAVVAPDSSGGENVHDALPFHGGSVGGGWTEGWDQKLDPGGPPNFVHPGEVVGFNKLTLDPHGGPQCSALLSGADRSVELGIGTVLVLAEADTP